MRRQNEHVAKAIKIGRSMGLTHLCHLDADELLYLPRGREPFLSHLAAVARANSYSAIQNIEAVYEKSECEDPFQNTKFFCTNLFDFAAYSNGKAIGQLRNLQLRVKGVHSFTGEQQKMPLSVAVVVHYESSCLPLWEAKFRRFNSKELTAKNEPCPFPFAYYCESMDAFLPHYRGSPEDVWRKWRTVEGHSKDDLLELDILQRTR